MTQRALTGWGGTEMITIEVANELQRRGHEVAVFSPRLGIPASLMQSNGVWVKSRLNEIPWTPDVIHGHHHLQAMAALSYFGDTPAIFCSHGSSQWAEQVPIHDRIRQYVVMSEGMVPRLGPMYGVSPALVTVVPNFVNTKRFSTVRQAPARPARALLFGGSGFSQEELSGIEAACADQGLSLDKIGYAYENPRPRPETFLPDYDLVFAIGRCAIEALASGCAVIPIVPGQAGNLVTPENFDDCAYTNFAPRYFRSGTQVGTDWLKAELAHYRPEATAQVTERVRSTRSLDQAVDRFEALYAKAIGDPKSTGRRQAPGEFAAYLEKLSAEVDILLAHEMEVEGLRAQLRSREKYIEYLQRHLFVLYRTSIGYSLLKFAGKIFARGRKIWLRRQRHLPRQRFGQLR